MKKLQKFISFIGLLATTTSLMAPHAKAQDPAEKNEPDSPKIEGEFSLQGFYDCMPYNVNPDFSPAAIPKLEDQNNKKRVGFDVTGAKLKLSKKFPRGDNAIEFVVESGLSKEGVKLKKIYIDHKNFRAGLAMSNFCDPSALPEMLCDAPCSAALASVAQVDWKDQLKALSYGIALEKAVKLDIYPGVKKKEKDKKELTPLNNLPAVSAMMKYEESIGYFRLGGLFRMLECYAKAADKTHYQPAWGINLTSSLKVIPDKTTVKLCGVYGRGMGSYLVDLASSEKDCKDVFLKGDATPTLINTAGGYVGLEHCWLPQLRSTVVYGMLATNKSKDRAQDAYKQGHFFSYNLTYHPTENLMLGLEYLFGRRFTIADKNGQDAHRIQAAVGFTF